MLVLVVALTGCGGDELSSPEDVVRAWSRALNAGDDGAAADLFAVGAQIEQGGLRLTVRTRADPLAWNRSLPCSGRIVDLETMGEDTTATFLLGNRGASACDVSGGRVTAVFRVREGKIVLFRQLADETVPLEPI
ncbi:MAG: hypothetical protein ACRDOS_01930 [Gaiellaceae bacterium]